jgi:hypothetical protein
MSYLDWMAHFYTRAICMEIIAWQRWPDGFLCTKRAYPVSSQRHQM